MSDLREKVARAIQNKIPGWLAEDGSVDDKDLADAAIYICIEEMIKLIDQAAKERASDGDPEGAGVIEDLAVLVRSLKGK